MDFEKICRLCLEESASMWEIFGGDKSDSLIGVFSRILQIQINENDQLPQQLCEECLTAVTKLDETIKTYRENDEKLRKLLHQPVQVKVESVEMETEYLEELEVLKTEEAEDDQIGYLKHPKEFEDVETTNELLTEMHSETEETVKRVKRSSRVRKVQEGKKGVKERPKKREGFRKRPKLGDFRCYVCESDSFGSAEALLAHLGEHSDELPYTCTICVRKTVVITTVLSLNVHKRMHANPVPCPHCDSRFTNSRSIDLHITMRHQDLAPDKTPSTCPKCGKIFLSAKALRLHKRSHDPPIPCEVCGKVLKSKNLLNRHVKRVHGNADRFKCHICNKTLIALHALQNHITTMHSDEKFKCKFCPRYYPSKSSLTYHEKQHELNPNYTETMSNHWRQYYTVEGEKGSEVKTCTLCGLVIGKSINQHYTSKHFPQAKRKHHCDQCNAVFRNKSNLEVHLLEHSLGKFLKCPICDKEFAQKRYLLLHMRTKKHKDHPLAQSLEWMDSDLPSPLPNRVRNEVLIKQEMPSS